MVQYLWLIPLGVLIGAYGTLIGAGGGFLLVPLLIIFCPDARPETITSVSLAVVFFNALSGSYAYARMKRIDYKSGLLFSSTAVPGAVLGAYATAYLPRRVFDLTFALLLVAVSIFLLLYPRAKFAPRGAKPPGHLRRRIVDGDQTPFEYSFSPLVGLSLSFAVGFLSSLLGTGGGIIHVPAMAGLLNFPVHVATATSHFVLAITALAGTLVHVFSGSFTEGIRRTICLAIGVLAGAQFGARVSTRIHGDWIIRALALALGLVAVRILVVSL